MATVTLHTGTVTTSGGASGSLVGSGAVWNDGSDSTYLDTSATRGTGQVFAGTAPLDALSLPSGATVNSVAITHRAARHSSSTSTQFEMISLIHDSGYDFQVGPSGFDAADALSGTSAMDLSHTLDSDDYTGNGVSLSELVTALEAGAYLDFWCPAPATTGTNRAFVFEASVVVDYTAATPTSSVPPPLRLTNRSDMYGSARSLTRSDASRQGGNRLTGYL